MGLSVPPKIPNYTLQSPDRSITFDGLAVASVLPNPRAGVSAVRLYTQWDRHSFRWPYLTMLGGALPSLGALVEHVLAPNNSVHPALSLALQNARKLSVRGNIVFRELPLDFSNEWLSVLCDFKPSASANNDILVVNVDGLDVDEAGRGTHATPRSRAPWYMWVSFFLIDMSSGFALAAALLVSLFWGDIWATVLFFIYFSHWAVSALISRSSMIGRRQPAPVINEDDRTRFAIHERKEGGTIVFKGRQDSIERWARQTWQFNNTIYHVVLHWGWVLTGTWAAIISTAAMVNMRATLQLVFLGFLLVSSIVELGLSRIGQNTTMAARQSSHELLKDATTRTEAIIRSWLEPDPVCRLDGLDWVGLGLLPDFPEFRAMQKMLEDINRIRATPRKDQLDSILSEFRQNQTTKLADRIAAETERVATRALRFSSHVDDQKKLMLATA